MPSILDRIQKLPREIQDLLASEEISEINERVLTEHDVAPEDEVAVLRLVQEVYFQDRAVESFLDGLRGSLPGWSDDRLRALARDLIGYRLLPMSGYLRGVHDALVKLGGDPTTYRTAAAGSTKNMTVEAAIATVVAIAKVSFANLAAERRFHDACATFFRGVRDAMETRDVLERGEKTGGVGLTPEHVEAVMQALDELRKSVVVDGAPPDAGSAVSAPAAVVAPMLSHAEAAEVHQMDTGVVNPTRVVIANAVDRIIQKTGAKFKNEDVTRRFRTAIESRLRDIRDYRETLDLLTKPSTQGGFGIPEPMAKKVLAVVEGEVRTLHQAKERRGGVYPLPRADIKSAPTSVTPIETKEVAPTTAITSQLVHPLPPKPVPPPPPPIPEPKSASPLPKKNPIAQPAPVPPPAPKPPPPPVIARSRSEEAIPSTSVPGLPRPDGASGLAMTVKKQDVPRPVAPPPPIVKQIPVAKPPPVPSRESEGVSREKGASLSLVTTAPPPPMLTPHASRLTPPSAAGRPRLEDIRPVPPRLVGPIEELQRLTIQDFRKIAKVPAEAAARIVEKLALLEKDSYTKRAEGVKALRGSALMVAYAEVVNAAFLAKRKVDDLIVERSQADKGSLTLDEFHALMGLNAQLRF